MAAYHQMDKQLFVGTVREWLACDAELAKLQQQARELRERKKKLGAVVIRELEEKNLQGLDTGTAQLRVATTRRRQPLTKKYLESKLAEMFGSGTDAYKAAEDKLINSRPIKEQKELKAKKTKG